MASTIRKKTPCSKCDKAAGILTCRGCEKDFCYPHVIEHREGLNKTMDEVAVNHNQLQQTITDHQAQPNSHPLMKKIDVWEQKSIDKIHQAANDARNELLAVLDAHRNKVTENLTDIAQELSKAREEDDYVEIDLKDWIEKLENLKKDLAAAHTIDFGEDDNSNTCTLISKIFINGASTDFFDRTVGDIHIIENGRVTVHGQMHGNAAVRCRGEYSSGQYQLRFKLEKWNNNAESFSCGIISKNTSVESLLYASNSYDMHIKKYHNPGAFIAHNNNNLFYFSSGNCYQKDDIVELLIDCDQRTIRLTNERTSLTQQLNVNLTTCPFPWQCFVTLLYANDSVRLCDAKPVGTFKRRN